MTTPKFLLHSYRPKSAGARYLSEALQKRFGYEIPRILNEELIRSNSWLINWGDGAWRPNKASTASNVRVFNPARQVCRCVEKLTFFAIMDDAGVSIPRWTESMEQAREWIRDGMSVYCRTDTEGRDGRGIVVANKLSEMVAARLYTLAVPSTEEFRVHVFQHRPIFDLVKHHHHPSKTDIQVRSGSNGWNYHRDVVVPPVVKELAVDVSRALGMDFCAVDLLYDARTRQAVALEANSAPELGPWTSAAYAAAFAKLL